MLRDSHRDGRAAGGEGLGRTALGAPGGHPQAGAAQRALRVRSRSRHCRATESTGWRDGLSVAHLPRQFPVPSFTGHASSWCPEYARQNRRNCRYRGWRERESRRKASGSAAHFQASRRNNRARKAETPLACRESCEGSAADAKEQRWMTGPSDTSPPRGVSN